MKHNATHSFTFLIAFSFTLLCITFLSITSQAQNTSPVYAIEFNKIQNGIMDEGKLEKNQLEDYDNNPVCLVKVKSQGFDEATLQKLIFVPRNIMIMHKAYENGEYRLYVSSKKPGSILIKYQGEYEFRLPYNLEPKKIYELVLGMETATLVIRATPEESVIYVDDEKVGTGNVSQAVSVGAEHRYRVECENYFEKEDVVMFQKGERKSLYVELEPAFGYITVKTTPSGADVYVDDKFVGRTPYLSEVIKRGMHKITVNKEGFETAVQRVNINVNEEQSVEFKLVEGESSMPVQQVVPTGGVVAGASGGKTNKSSALTGTLAGHEYVDLGLPSGTLWATCNVGANRPEDYGDYYAWGETTIKTKYKWNTYKWCRRGSWRTQTKYNTKSEYGTVDNKTVLEMSDDAASVNWGSDWRMPTTEEWKELCDRCTWTWATQGGENGYRVTGPNGKSIFLPAAGFRYGTSLSDAGSSGRYWSSSLSTSNPGSGRSLNFHSSNFGMNYRSRCDGYAVRPVCPPQD